MQQLFNSANIAQQPSTLQCLQLTLQGDGKESGGGGVVSGGCAVGVTLLQRCHNLCRELDWTPEWNVALWGPEPEQGRSREAESLRAPPPRGALTAPALEKPRAGQITRPARTSCINEPPAPLPSTLGSPAPLALTWAKETCGLWKSICSMVPRKGRELGPGG